MVEYFCIGCGKPVTKGKVVVDKKSYDVKREPYVILHCPSDNISKEIEEEGIVEEEEGDLLDGLESSDLLQ